MWFLWHAGRTLDALRYTWQTIASDLCYPINKMDPKQMSAITAYDLYFKCHVYKVSQRDLLVRFTRELLPPDHIENHFQRLLLIIDPQS